MKNISHPACMNRFVVFTFDRCGYPFVFFFTLFFHPVKTSSDNQRVNVFSLSRICLPLWVSHLHASWIIKSAWRMGARHRVRNGAPHGIVFLSSPYCSPATSEIYDPPVAFPKITYPRTHHAVHYTVSTVNREKKRQNVMQQRWLYFQTAAAAARERWELESDSYDWARGRREKAAIEKPVSAKRVIKKRFYITTTFERHTDTIKALPSRIGRAGPLDRTSDMSRQKCGLVLVQRNMRHVQWRVGSTRKSSSIRASEVSRCRHNYSKRRGGGGEKNCNAYPRCVCSRWLWGSCNDKTHRFTVWHFFSLSRTGEPAGPVREYSLSRSPGVFCKRAIPFFCMYTIVSIPERLDKRISHPVFRG